MPLWVKASGVTYRRAQSVPDSPGKSVPERIHPAEQMGPTYLTGPIGPDMGQDRNQADTPARLGQDHATNDQKVKRAHCTCAPFFFLWVLFGI